jgi:coproporphyrinogen III oxidase-like Fe-S oxidoreductase
LIEQTDVSAEDSSREHLLMNLRLTEGLDLADYRMRWDRDLDSGRIAPLIEEGLLRRDADRLVITPRGRLVLNAVISAIAD